MSSSAQQVRRHALYALVLTFAVVSLPQRAPAQEEAAQEQSVEAQIDALIQEIEKRNAELEEMDAKLGNLEDTATRAILEKELSDRRSSQRRDLAKLVELVNEGADAGADVAQARATALEILEKDATAMHERLKALNTEGLTLVETMEKGGLEDANKAREAVVESLSSSNRLIGYLDANIDQRETLGADVESEVEALKTRLQVRATMISGLLKNTKQRIDEISGRPKVSEDAEAQKELAALKKVRDALADAQRITVSLMDKYGLETAELKQGIISATGKLSQDVLDTEVASGLIEAWFADVGDWLRTNGAAVVFQVLVFLLILFAFWVLARIGRSAVSRGLDRSKLKVSSLAKDFFVKTTGRLILLIGLIIAVAQLGVEVGPVLAGLGIAGFVIGFALQDTLSNFASGLMILVYRPFDVGDAVEAGGVLGKVDQMNLVSTMILTFDNQLMIVPNKQIWGGVIRNITNQTTRRVDLTFGIGYSDDIPKAEKVLTEIVMSHEKVLKDPEPVIKLHELGDSSVNFIVRPWSNTADYWDVYWDITREVKRRFDEEGISIPFPQRDVHIYNESKNGED